MPRRFRLSVHRKNEYRKAREATAPLCTVTVQHICVKPTAINVGNDMVDALETAEELKVSIPINVLYDSGASTIAVLMDRIKTLPPLSRGWTLADGCTDNVLVLAKTELMSGFALVKFGLEITSDFKWNVCVGKVRIPSDSDFLQVLPQVLHSVSSIREVMQHLETLHFCVGNADEKYFPLQAARKGAFMDSTGSKLMASYVQDFFSHYTIRCSSCILLVSFADSRCRHCSEYRRILNSMLSHQRNDEALSSHPESHTNFRYLSASQKEARLKSLHQKVKSCNIRVKRLQDKIAKLIDERGIEVDSNLHEDLVATMEDSNTRIGSEYPPGSFPHIFWKQQYQAMKRSDARSMKWEPAMIRWCLYLRHLSSSAYEVLRSSGVLHLPSQRTLRDYTYHTESAPGFSTSVDKYLMDVANILTCPERERNVIIIFDEMHIKESLVYDKHTGAIIGFTNLGNINSHLAKVEKSVEESSSDQLEPLANSILVLMVRGLFSKLQFPYAQFPCNSLHGYELYDIFWEAVERLERCGFNVLACTCDGLSVNRRFFLMHGTNKLVYKVVNPYSEEKRPLFFFSDPPHLMKTVRNCWSSNKRLLWNEGKHIQWSHLIELYQTRCSNTTTPGLTILPKLKYEHVYLTSFSKMRVDLAAQVLSNSVGKALSLKDDPELEKTIEFVHMFDKFFDCLNVSHFEAGKQSRNAFKAPYHSTKDFRIKWLKEEFLGYLDKWEKSVRERKNFKRSEQNKMLLSAPTRSGLHFTVLAFTELVEYVFQIDGVKAFLSNRICQDPLENFFGRQRQRGRVNENPNAAEFFKNTQALRVINSTSATVRGNCRGPKKRKSDGPIEIENSPLQKRKSYRSSKEPKQ